MLINPPQLVPLSQLRPFADNPKRPIGRKYLVGLRASIARFGFAGVLQTGENADGTDTVLDGNTRLEELDRAGVKEVWVQRVPSCREGMPGWEEERRTFVLAHDRNRKVFDEDVVARQLQQLAETGADLKALGALTAKDNLDRILAAATGAGKSGAAAAPAAPPPAMSSLVLYGPATELQAVQGLLKQVRGRLSTLEKSRQALGQSLDFLSWDDPRLLAVLLATLARFGESS